MLVRMSKSTAFLSSHSELALQPIEPSWVKTGTPVARAITLTESPDGLLTTGIWDCTAGTFTWIFQTDEIVHILEGEVTVRDGSTVHELKPGSVCYFPQGLETTWEVRQYVKKTFVLLAPHRSRLRRLASKVKSLIRP